MKIRSNKKRKIVVVGGGTGSFTVLSGLKAYPVELSAVVAMADDGGSTGLLRDELGVLPPGDIRQCLVALSSSDLLMRELMNYRFQKGGLMGHSFGNLLLSALEKTTGSFDRAVEKASDILRIRGRVIPATLQKVALVARVGKKVVRGQRKVFGTLLNAKATLTLTPRATANPKALTALKEADAIVIGPGDFYSSLIPNLLVRGIPEAIRRSKAKKIYVCNLMTKENHTNGWGVRDFTDTIERYIGTPVDYIIYNKKEPPRTLILRYAREGEECVMPEATLEKKRFVGGNLLGTQFPRRKKHELITRNLIRHNPNRLAHIIMRLLNA